ncbi:hypothetical protein C8Q78DRAFT_993345 [Trametes maxima]|nr:hypothetical protein C8Q78DRAFT_993345 [Trametes maxima]
MRCHTTDSGLPETSRGRLPEVSYIFGGTSPPSQRAHGMPDTAQLVDAQLQRAVVSNRKRCNALELTVKGRPDGHLLNRAELGRQYPHPKPAYSASKVRGGVVYEMEVLDLTTSYPTAPNEVLNPVRGLAYTVPGCAILWKAHAGEKGSARSKDDVQHKWLCSSAMT